MYSFCYLILFLSSQNCLSEFPCSLLIFFITATLISLSVRYQSSVIFILVAEESPLSFCDTTLSWFFMVFDGMCLFRCVQSSKHLSYSNICLLLTGWKLEIFLLFSSRWQYSSGVCFSLHSCYVWGVCSCHHHPPWHRGCRDHWTHSCWWVLRGCHRVGAWLWSLPTTVGRRDRVLGYCPHSWNCWGFWHHHDCSPH